jgi:hypothetical protein
MRVQFIHGLESSPRSRKARVLGERFDLLCPAMDTGDFEACVGLQSEAVAMWGPEVLIGSSFGGAVATALLQRGLWRGRTLLLATATLRRAMPIELPAGVPVHLVHATDDEIVPVEDARKIAAASDPAWLQFDEVEDDHALTRHVRDGSLVRWVRALAER